MFQLLRNWQELAATNPFVRPSTKPFVSGIDLGAIAKQVKIDKCEPSAGETFSQNVAKNSKKSASLPLYS